MTTHPIPRSSQICSDNESIALQKLLEANVKDAMLVESCRQLVKACPASERVITGLVDYFSSHNNHAVSPVDGSSVTKKRKLEAINFDTSKMSQLQCKLVDLSCQVPRKKCTMLLFEKHLQLLSIGNDSVQGGVVEASLAYVDVERALILPTPAKAVPYSTVVIMSRTGSHIMFNFAKDIKTTYLPFESDLSEVKELKKKRLEDNDELLCCIFALVAPALRFDIPVRSDFESKFPMSHGTGSKSKESIQLYASCYMKAKEGQLYFLSSGIFFGLKKPFFFLSKERIQVIGIQNLTTRTFNLGIEYTPNQPEVQQLPSVFGTKKGNTHVSLEFDMIDHCEFEPIMQYLKKYSLDQIRIAGIEGEITKNPAEEPSGDEHVADFAFDEDYNESEDEDFDPVETASGASSSSSDEEGLSSDGDITVDEGETADESDED